MIVESPPIKIELHGNSADKLGNSADKLRHPRIDAYSAEQVLLIFTSLLSQLHWLPVSKWIQFKIATLTYQLVTFGQPSYLSSVLIPYQPQRSLR